MKAALQSMSLQNEIVSMDTVLQLWQMALLVHQIDGKIHALAFNLTILATGFESGTDI
jgi:hypothetical protein